MKYNIQTRLHKGMSPKDRGNCLATVISCIMDLDSAEDVLQVQEYAYNQWYPMLRKWLKKQGHELKTIEGHQKDDSFYFVIGTSPRDKLISHICIYQNGKLVHDPHPDGIGILSEERFNQLKQIGVLE